MRSFVALVLLTACGSPGPHWHYGIGPYTQEEQETAALAAMDVYREVLGDETIDKALDRWVDISWRYTPFACGRVALAAGCFAPRGDISVLAAPDQHLADTALAHELLHLALYSMHARGQYAYYAPDQAEYSTGWLRVITSAQDVMRAVLP